MRKGISIWAFRENDLTECFRLAKRSGYEGVELALDEHGPVSLDSTDEGLRSVAASARAEGIRLYSLASGLYWQYSLTADDPSQRKRAKEIATFQLRAASVLGCDTILVLPGMVGGLGADGPVVPYDVAYDRALEAVKELAAVAEQYKVNLGLENVWNKFLLSPLEFRDFLDKVGSPYVKAYFDVGNVLVNGYPEQWIRILGSRIAKIHFKDFRRSVGNIEGFVDLLSGDVNYPEVLKALGEVGYDGWVTAEVFPYQLHPEALLATSSKAMDFILGQE